MKNMKKKWYEDIEELCEDVVETYVSLENDLPTVSVIAKFDEAREVIAGLCSLGYLPYSVNIEEPEYDNYYDEWLVELTENGIYSKRFKRKKGYTNCNSDYVFVLDNCSSKVIAKINPKHSTYEVSIGECDDFDFVFEDDDEECEVSVDSEEDMHGFTVSRNSDDGYSSLSFYSTEKLCACEMQHLLDIFRL